MPGDDFEAIEVARQACGLRPSREITAAEADELILANRRQRPAALAGAPAAAADNAEAAFLRGLLATAGAPADREPVTLATRGPWVARPIVEPAPLPDAVRLRLPLRVRAALWYASALAWPVFPCRPADKRPHTEHGFKDAALEPRQILNWWRRWPDALVAMPTGHASGVAVIDVDCKNGVDGFAALMAAGIVMPETWLARSRSGGAHYYFQAPRWPDEPLRSAAPIKLFGKALPGVDIRASGGYVILPAGRGGYRWSRLRPGRSILAPMPRRLLEGLRWKAPERPAPVYPHRPAAGGGFERTLDDVCRAIATAAPGTRQETLSARAWQAGRLAGEGKVDPARALAAVLAAAGAINGADWDKRAALQTAQRRFEAGARGNA